MSKTNTYTSRVFKVRFEFKSSSEYVDYYTNIINAGLSHRSIFKWLFVFVPISETQPVPFADVFLQFKFSTPVSRIENWFPFGKVSTLSGKDVFFRSIAEVLTSHYDTEGVPLISSESCKNKLLLNSNFNWFTEISDYLKREAKRNLKSDIDPVSDYDKMKFDILNSGMTLKDCQEQNNELYVKNKMEFEALRLGYIAMNTDGIHHNYYIYSAKDLLLVFYRLELIRSLFPDCNSDTTKEYLDSLTFEFNGNNFLGYDGQPVVVYDLKDDDTYFHNISEIVDLGYNGDYAKFFEGFGGTGISGKFNIIVSDVSFDDFISGASESVKKRLYDLFPLVNVIYVPDSFATQFMKRNAPKKDDKGSMDDFKITII